MRIIGLLGIVFVLAIVGLLVKKQLAGVANVSMPAAAVTGAPPPGGTTPSSPADARAQSQQIQQQIKQSLDAAMQAPRPMPDDAK